MKILLTAILSVALTVAAFFAFTWAFRGGSLSGPPPATVVRTETAARGPLVEVVSVPGEVQPAQKVQISSRVPAQIVALPRTEGQLVDGFDLEAALRAAAADPVAATQPVEPPASSILVRLDARDLRATLDSAEARGRAQAAEIGVARTRIEAQRSTIAATAATLADAERELGRQQSLLKTADVAQQAVDQAQTKVSEQRYQLEAARSNLAADEQNLTVLKHNVDASRADIEKAREQLAYTVITSSISGTVIRVNSKVGETVVPGIQGSVGSVILEVADLSRMLMIARVDETSVARLRQGQRAVVRMQAYRDRVFEGTVESIGLARAEANAGGGAAARAAASTGDSNYYEVKILLKTDGEPLFCGLTADADIETERHTGVRVPSQAVLGRPPESLPEALRSRVGDKNKAIVPVVFRYVDGKAVATPVTVGPSDETHTLITEGLAEGAAVITGPYKVLESLTDGQKVTQERAAPATQPAATTAPTTTTTRPATTGATTRE